MDVAPICSGLLSYPDIHRPTSCERRDRCRRYVHWSIDARSDFNLCAPAQKSWEFFIPITEQHAIKRAGQLELFS